MVGLRGFILLLCFAGFFVAASLCSVTKAILLHLDIFIRVNFLPFGFTVVSVQSFVATLRF
jgi:hypothetical protein